jgi:hypothetical protein
VARRVYEALGFQMYVTYGAAYFDEAFPASSSIGQDWRRTEQ